MKKIQIVAILASLAAVGSAHAQLELNAGLAVGGSGSYTSSSLSLNALQLVESANGDFSPAVQSGSGLTADTINLTGLSTTAKTENIADFLEFSSNLINPGTSPTDEFSFTLTSITEVSFTTAYGGFAEFTGTGYFVDSTGTYADTDATFTLGTTGEAGGAESDNFSMSTVAPVPEPTTFIAGAAMLLPFGVGAFRSLRKDRKA
jgi:hypothetical protein